MKVAFFSTKTYDRQSFEAANANYRHELTFFDVQLNGDSAVLAAEFPAVCMFVNDIADAATLEILASRGTRLSALRSDDLFFEDHSDNIIQNDTFQLLQSFSNVVITAHQGFFTRNALAAIADTTLSNITDFEQGQPLKNEVAYQPSASIKVSV